MALANPNVQQRNQYLRDWGNYDFLVDLPNASGWTGGATNALERGDTAYVTGVGPVSCSSAGTPGLLNAVWVPGGGGGGITELTGDVAAGPGSGSVVATIAPLAVTASKIALGTITNAQIAAANIDGTAATPSLRTLGSGAAQACAGNDPRLSDPRIPTGPAGGDLGGSYATPTVIQARGLRETSGPTTLVIGAIADGEYLVRSGATVIGAPSPGGVTIRQVQLNALMLS